MPITVIEGEQRGDEGKGRFVDMLAPDFDIVARYNGGPNAGHTVVTPTGKVFKLHSIPSGIAHDGVMNIIGNGTFIDPIKLEAEIQDISRQGRSVHKGNLLISSAAHLITPEHVSADEIREAGQGKQGTTKSGISQVAAARALREGKRMESIKNDLQGLFATVRDGVHAHRDIRDELGLPPIDADDIAEVYVESARRLSPHITDTALFLYRALRTGKNILAEGAQAFLLDPDHGMYPYVTSSSTGASGVSAGLGVPPMAIKRVIGVIKATQSHVGGGPFVTEIHDPEMLTRLHGDMSTIDAEKGTTTGRVRRLGHLDLPAIRRAKMVNGTQELAITKLDWLNRYGETILVCTGYIRKGKLYEIAPDAAYKLEQCEPVYEHLPGWDDDISGIRTFEALPEEARNYISFLEAETDTDIKMIGVGPGRDQVIVRE